PTSQKRDVGHPQAVEHPHPREREPQAGGEADGEQGSASDAPFEFSPELMAKFEEIERLSPDDPTRAERICAAVAAGANELRAQGLGLLDISPLAGLPGR